MLLGGISPVNHFTFRCIYVCLSIPLKIETKGVAPLIMVLETDKVLDPDV